MDWYWWLLIAVVALAVGYVAWVGWAFINAW